MVRGTGSGQPSLRRSSSVQDHIRRAAADMAALRTPGHWKWKGRGMGKGTAEGGGGGGAAPPRPPLGTVWRELRACFGGNSGLWRARERSAAGAQEPLASHACRREAAERPRRLPGARRGAVPAAAATYPAARPPERGSHWHRHHLRVRHAGAVQPQRWAPPGPQPLSLLPVPAPAPCSCSCPRSCSCPCPEPR